MSFLKKLCAAALAAVLLCAAMPVWAAAAEQTEQEEEMSVLFYSDDRSAGLGEKITVTIKARNVPERGMSSALIGVRFDKRLTFERALCSISSDLKGNRTIGTKDIDRGEKFERRFMWVGTESVYDDYVFATAVFTVPEDVAAGEVFEFELVTSTDPKNYIDASGVPIAVSSEDLTITIRDYLSALTLAAGDAKTYSTAADVAVTLGTVADIRGGLASASFALEWSGAAALSSVAADAGSASVAESGEGRAVVSWTSEKPLEAETLTFTCSFDLSACADGYKTAVTPSLSGADALVSGGGVSEGARVTASPGTLEWAHTLAFVPAVDPACEQPGNIAHYKCEICERTFADENGETELFEDDVVIPAPGHDWGEWVKTADPTCDEPGEERAVCKKDATHIGTREIAPLGHDLTRFDAVEPTAEADGNIEYWKCSRCKRYFADAEAKFETDAEGVILVFAPEAGDVNRDGALNSRDVLLTLAYLVGWSAGDYPALASFAPELADLDESGTVNARDVIAIINKILAVDVQTGEAIAAASGAVNSASRGVIAAAASGAGDVNADGKINSKDVIALMKAIVSNNYTLSTADVNGDKKVNSRDVIALMKMIVGVAPGTGKLDTGVKIDGYPQSYNDFLSGAVFCGDSICTGLEAYNILPANNVVAANGAGVFTIRNKDYFTFDVDGASYQFDEALRKLSPKSVVLWLGINDSAYPTETFKSKYRELIDAVKKDAPGADICSMSITPIGDGTTLEPYGVTNSTIDTLNAALKLLAGETGAKYVDISTMLKGADNKLKAEYAAYDGIHIPYSAYPPILKTFLDSAVG